jgi:hypothetical protein
MMKLSKNIGLESQIGLQLSKAKSFSYMKSKLL